MYFLRFILGCLDNKILFGEFKFLGIADMECFWEEFLWYFRCFFREVIGILGVVGTFIRLVGLFLGRVEGGEYSDVFRLGILGGIFDIGFIGFSMRVWWVIWIFFMMVLGLLFGLFRCFRRLLRVFLESIERRWFFLLDDFVREWLMFCSFFLVLWVLEFEKDVL